MRHIIQLKDFVKPLKNRKKSKVCVEMNYCLMDCLFANLLLFIALLNLSHVKQVSRNKPCKY